MLLQLGIVSVIIGLIVAATLDSEEALAQSQLVVSEPTHALDPATYTAVRKLRHELALTNSDLAAMGCSQADAERVLGALLVWYQSNKDSLEAKERLIRQDTRRLRELRRKIQIGTRDTSVARDVAALREQLVEKMAERKQLVEAAIPTVRNAVSVEQASYHESAIANQGLARELRFAPGLSKSQIEGISVVRNNNQFQTEMDRVLTYGQKLAIQQAAINQREKIRGAQLAERNVLPMPSQLLGEDNVRESMGQ